MSEIDSDRDRLSLIEPQVNLYANRSLSSWEAFDALESNGIMFQVIPALERDRPAATWAERIHEGVDEIKILASALRAFDEAAEDNTGLEEVLSTWSLDPEAPLRYEALVNRRMLEARKVMEEIFQEGTEKIC